MSAPITPDDVQADMWLEGVNACRAIMGLPALEFVSAPTVGAGDQPRTWLDVATEASARGLRQKSAPEVSC